MGQPVPQPVVPSNDFEFPRQMNGSGNDIFNQQQTPQNHGRNSFPGDEGGFFNPGSSLKYDYDLGNDSLEAAIKDVLNQDLDCFPIGTFSNIPNLYFSLSLHICFCSAFIQRKQ